MIRLSITLGLALMTTYVASADELSLELRYQNESSDGSGRYHRLSRGETWDAKETAVIVCDVWDLHHCLNAVRRAEEFAPRLNKVLIEARNRGATIIHSPSDCMAAYEDHPARKRAIHAPKADNLPDDISSWCSRIPSEEKGVYPIDQSDGGEDDEAAEHAAWAARLKAMGRNPGTPWKAQSSLIEIDAKRDYISDRGVEVWNVLEARGIKNVILTGVHTNMCVLGRPFGLRQMARNGKNVVLMRDMTDTMYNPKSWPYVSHFTGTDLIIGHIERFVCPTITSDQLLGGQPFRSTGDTRPHIAIVMAEDEYETNVTLPEFASRYLGKDFRVSYVFGSDEERHEIPGIEVLDEVDLAIISVRRRVLQPKAMAAVRRFIESGKPVVGIRTANHAFSLRGKEPPEGFVGWESFDADVFGGNYSGHHGNKLKSTISFAEAAESHAVLTGLTSDSYEQGGSLYQVAPLKVGATPLLIGRIEGQPEEPVAWTFLRADKGRSFYTSLGHKKDFENPAFVRLFLNGIHWAVGLPPRDDVSYVTEQAAYERHWSPMPVPSSLAAASAGVLKDYNGVSWYRCVIRAPESWVGDDGLTVTVNAEDRVSGAWFNGDELLGAIDFKVPSKSIQMNDANLLVLRVGDAGKRGSLEHTPVVKAGDQQLALKGRWQFRIGDDESLANMPLPAKFGTGTDIIFEP